MQSVLIIGLGHPISEMHSKSANKHIKPDPKLANKFLVFIVSYCVACE